MIGFFEGCFYFTILTTGICLGLTIGLRTVLIQTVVEINERIGNREKGLSKEKYEKLAEMAVEFVKLTEEEEECE